MKILQVTAMHGRHQTVKYCLEQMPFMTKLFAVSSDDDIEFIDQQIGKVQFYIVTDNRPLSSKWQALISSLKQFEYDAVIIMGSDDYIDKKTYEYIVDCLDRGHDFIGFTDCYFMDNGLKYYWPGYQNSRFMEPIGAGRVLSRSLIEKIDHYLFRDFLNKGLDRSAWNVITKNYINPHITKLIDNDLMLCDVKDDNSMNPLKKIQNVIHLN